MRLPLSDSTYCNADPECNCTVWENITVANGSYNIDLIPGIIPEDYNYTFSVPWYDDLMYAGVYEDVWTGGCGMINFTYNGYHLGLLQIGGPGDNNRNGVWWCLVERDSLYQSGTD